MTALILQLLEGASPKGTDIFLNAIPKLCQDFPSLRIHFVGPDRSTIVSAFPELKATWQFIEQVSFNQVRCYGRVSDAEKLGILGLAHWVAIPSRFESFGLTAIEALRSGTPFIAAASGGLVETAFHAPMSLLVEPTRRNLGSASFHELLPEVPSMRNP